MDNRRPYGQSLRLVGFDDVGDEAALERGCGQSDLVSEVVCSRFPYEELLDAADEVARRETVVGQCFAHDLRVSVERVRRYIRVSGGVRRIGEGNWSIRSYVLTVDRMAYDLLEAPAACIRYIAAALRADCPGKQRDLRVLAKKLDDLADVVSRAYAMAAPFFVEGEDEGGE